MSVIDKNRFAQLTKVSRFHRSELDENGAPRRFGSRKFDQKQVVLETDQFVFVTRNEVAEGIEIPRMVALDPRWTLVEAFATNTLRGTRGGVDSRGVLTTSLTSETLERALQIACDMGRWDIAYMMILRVYGLAPLTPQSVIWERFPHASQMRVVSDSKLLVPSGLAKTIIERWWAWQGGYHGTSIHVDYEEYERFMNGIRNPFTLVGTSEAAVRSELNIELPVGVIPPALAPADLAGRAWYYGDGVAYLANSQGKVLPYWYVSGSEGSTILPESELAWGAEVRTNVARSMNLPILIMRRSSQR